VVLVAERLERWPVSSKVNTFGDVFAMAKGGSKCMRVVEYQLWSVHTLKIQGKSPAWPPISQSVQLQDNFTNFAWFDQDGRCPWTLQAHILWLLQANIPRLFRMFQAHLPWLLQANVPGLFKVCLNVSGLSYINTPVCLNYSGYTWKFHTL